jgi:hypothetical protein
MTDPKDSGGFFRKVVKFVANPSLEWGELSQGPRDPAEIDIDKAELKALIERKRRNDFVRKREFDMLRKVRREGLSPEQLAALGDLSPMGDSEIRLQEKPPAPGTSMKAKIDAIERQMVGNNTVGPVGTTGDAGSVSRPFDIGSAPTEPLPLRLLEGLSMPPSAATVHASTLAAAATQAGGSPSKLGLTFNAIETHSKLDLEAAETAPAALPAMVHDPELDEAVIAFANAEFAQCERSLGQLTQPSGSRSRHSETWLALFDLHRATGDAAKFDRLALVYAQQFGRSSPQWYSMPQQVAESSRESLPAHARVEGQVGWVSPEWITIDEVASLRSHTLQMPLPWVLDWSAVKRIDAEAAANLIALLSIWMPQKLEMRWLHGDRLLQCLQEFAPTGARDADPIFWKLRLDVLRMVNRPDQFDEAAIDYCITYEISPPSWDAVSCRVRLDGSGGSNWSEAGSVVSGVSTSFVESRITEEEGSGKVWGIDLSGQLVGDISGLLDNINTQAGAASVIRVSCLNLIRVDFIAAGDLLNWVLARCAENREINFVDAHRLVALFFSAMGINEHALIKVRAN